MPIPFGSLSGLSNDPSKSNILYAVEDSKFIKNRFFTIDTTNHPAELTMATRIMDSSGVLAAVQPQGEFSADDLAALINTDGTVNIDPEGIAADGQGNFYIAHEGKGNYGDSEEPVESLNLILKVDKNGVIHQLIALPEELNMIQSSSGFKGVAYHPSGCLVVCMQAAWGDNAGPLIGMYNLAEATWDFGVYTLDAPQSQNGGSVGLSDIAFVTGSENMFYVLERDDQAQLDAAIKRIYCIDLSGVDFSGSEYPSIGKILVKDLVADNVVGAIGGLNFEKFEGLAHNGEGLWVINNDYDGVKEIQLMNLGNI